MRVVSLFSGAGGLDLGFRMAGHEVVWANDLYADAVETYRTNMGGHIVCADIAKIGSESIPNCDIVIGGFPCQGFSVDNTKRHEADSRNVLYKQLLRVIRDKKPLFFLAENVKGIMSLAQGRAFETIQGDMRALGYSVKAKLFNAADYGIPQRRERVIFVGVRRELAPVQTFPLDYVFRGPLSSVYRQIGNAVPPRFAFLLARQFNLYRR